MSRVEVKKTYKLYVGGKFIRSESGRYFSQTDAKGNLIANVNQASRKDLRNAVVAARKAFSDWNERSAYNIGQIIYRIAENLESRKEELTATVIRESGSSSRKGKKEVEKAIDRLIYYAGWSDKYQQIYSSVNPVSSSHFNFSILEPTGVVGVLITKTISFADILSLMAAVISGRNSLIIVSPLAQSTSMLTFAEVLHHSDLPAGVVNFLSGDDKELKKHMVTHQDINAVGYLVDKIEDAIEVEQQSVSNLKRTIDLCGIKSYHTPQMILKFQEVKTTWHPIEQIAHTGPSY
jgi:acyl-CoA reductase-like NAD-dependent aldehyde dehydrogenase